MLVEAHERTAAEFERKEAFDEDTRAREVHEILDWAQTHAWNALILASASPHVQPKGLLVVQPGRPAGVLKILVDVEPEADAGE